MAAHIQTEGRSASVNGGAGGECVVGVEAHAPRPAQDTDVEVEDRARVTAGEQDREERDDGQDDERDPQKHEHDEMRDREDSLDQPQPAAEVLVKLSFELQRIDGSGAVLVHGTHLPLKTGVWTPGGANFKVSRGSPALLLGTRAAIEAAEMIPFGGSRNAAFQ